MKHKRYPCGWGNPNDIGSGIGEKKVSLPSFTHENCKCVLLPISRQSYTMYRFAIMQVRWREFIES